MFRIIILFCSDCESLISKDEEDDEDDEEEGREVEAVGFPLHLFCMMSLSLSLSTSITFNRNVKM